MDNQVSLFPDILGTEIEEIVKKNAKEHRSTIMKIILKKSIINMRAMDMRRRFSQEWSKTLSV